MKALTLWQPWATLVALGVKPFETRAWATRYRGPLAIHAAQRPPRQDLVRSDPAIAEALAAAGWRLENLPLGVILCTARLAACWPTEAILADGLADPFGDYRPGRFAWYLHAICPLEPPPPAVGRQGLWEWRG